MGLFDDIGLGSLVKDITDIRDEISQEFKDIKKEVADSYSDIDNSAKQRISDMKQSVRRPFASGGDSSKPADSDDTKSRKIDIQ